MISPIDLMRVIRMVTKDLGAHSENVERQILGTACQESGCGHKLWQYGDGPARGIYQSERPPMLDNLAYLWKRPALKKKAENWFHNPLESWVIDEIHEELVWNLAAATVMCRVHYLRFPEPIPDNLPGQAAYYKTCYNTVAGKATEEEYIANWKRFVPAGTQWV